MARIETELTAVECRWCGKLHEVCYVANEGAMGGGFSYRCRDEIRPVSTADKRHTVTLGLSKNPERVPQERKEKR
jgi:hypothetical protein